VYGTVDLMVLPHSLQIAASLFPCLVHCHIASIAWFFLDLKLYPHVGILSFCFDVHHLCLARKLIYDLCIIPGAADDWGNGPVASRNRHSLGLLAIFLA